MPTTGTTRNTFIEAKAKKLLDWSVGNTARPWLATSDSPSNIEYVPSVTMIEGRPRPIARTPLTRPRMAPKLTPPRAASHGLNPATIISAATTAEKLNIQPTERSISRIASKKTMPSDSMPWNVVLPRIVNRLIGLRKRGRATPMTTIIASRATMTPISSGNRNERARIGVTSEVSDSCDAGSSITLLLPRPRFRCRAQLGIGACNPSLIHRN
jgi:hypothetical protein